MQMQSPPVKLHLHGGAVFFKLANQKPELSLSSHVYSFTGTNEDNYAKDHP